MNLVIIILILVLFTWLAYPFVIYNRLVSLRNRFKNAFSQIDVQLTRRHDLIPNLVETAKEYMKFERETLQAVIEARGHAVSAVRAAAERPEDPGAIKTLMGAEGALSASLGRLLAVAESYPDLKANKTMTMLMEELSSTENRVAFARQAFNDSVMEYNTYREKFPNSVIADPFGFAQAQLYEVEEPEAKKPVKVSFS